MDEVEYLLNNGFKILKLIKDTKIPIEGSRGFYDARDNWSLLELDGHNLGIRCGSTSNYLVVFDIDKRNGGDKTFQDMIAEHGPLPKTWTVKTKDGRHYYFKGETKTFKDQKGGVDLISEGAYVVMPPSIVNEHQYQWEISPFEVPLAEIPLWLVSWFENRKEKKINIYRNEDETFDEDEPEMEYIRQDLSRIPPDCGYDEWVRVGMALHSIKAPWGFELFDEWSSGGEKYKKGECEKKWNSFQPDKGITWRTISHISQPYLRAYLHSVFPNLYDADGNLKETVKSQVQEIATRSPHTDPICPMPLPKSGLLRELYEMIYSQAMFKHEEFAMCSAISILSCLAQRSFELFGNSSTNSYNMIIGPSSVGKNYYIQTVKEILTFVAPEMLLDEIRSSQALKKALGEFPSRAIFEDEYIDIIKKAYDKKYKDVHIEAVSSLMLNLWSNQKILAGSKTKKKEDCINAVEYPRLSFLATGVPQSLEELISIPEALNKGMVSRCDFWFHTPDVPRNWNIKKIGFDPIVEKLKTFWNELKSEKFSMGQNKEYVKINVAEVCFDSETFELYKQYTDMMNLNHPADGDPINSIYRRTAERALKYASMAALFDARLEISHDDWVFGQGLAKRQTDNFIKFYNKDAITQDFLGIVNKTYETLKKLAQKNGTNEILLSELCKNCRAFRNLKPREQNEIVQTLTNDNLIVSISTESSRNGRKVQIKKLVVLDK